MGGCGMGCRIHSAPKGAGILLDFYKQLEPDRGLPQQPDATETAPPRDQSAGRHTDAVWSNTGSGRTWRQSAHDHQQVTAPWRWARLPSRHSHRRRWCVARTLVRPCVPLQAHWSPRGTAGTAASPVRAWARPSSRTHDPEAAVRTAVLDSCPRRIGIRMTINTQVRHPIEHTRCSES